MENILEVIAFNIESCQIAQQSGAHRIELCDNPGEGGTTPSFGMINAARKATSIQLYPIIRPRGGDFLYTEEEFYIMKEDVLICKELGCDGVVFGLLLADGRIDKERTAALVQLAYPMGVTFHRAFDRADDPFQAMEDIIACGCERILTSGQQPTATEGADLIRKLIEQAADRIVIMPGSGVRSNNLSDLKKHTGATEFHSSARTTTVSSMQYQSPSMNEQLATIILDKEEVVKLAAILQQ